ncbi:hypothetical protein BH11MYX2_BH11MYX2_23900 [soil metagenome]
MRTALAALLLMSTPAFAQDVVDSVVTTPKADQGIGASLGIAGGGRSTPGGLRVAGHYLYQLSSTDWFDGIASFTFGADSSGCYRDDMDAMQCTHSATSGSGVAIGATVRRMFGTGDIVPFARAGLGVQIVRFRADDVTGLAIPLHFGGGVRAKVAPAVAVVAQGELDLGVGAYTHGLGAEPILGLAITAGAEFELR